MNSFQWMIRRYTGAHVTLSPDELKFLEKRSNELASGKPARFWIITLCMAVGVVAGVVFGCPYPRSWLKATGLDKTLSDLLGTLMIALPMIIFWLWVFTRMYIKPMRKALNEMGHPICLRCGYWLKGLERSRPNCPECGTPRESPPGSRTVA